MVDLRGDFDIDRQTGKISVPTSICTNACRCMCPWAERARAAKTLQTRADRMPERPRSGFLSPWRQYHAYIRAATPAAVTSRAAKAGLRRIINKLRSTRRKRARRFLYAGLPTAYTLLCGRAENSILPRSQSIPYHAIFLKLRTLYQLRSIPCHSLFPGSGTLSLPQFIPCRVKSQRKGIPFRAFRIPLQARC